MIQMGSPPAAPLKRNIAGIGIIILSAHKEREYLNLMAAQEMSGWSYLLKQSVTDAEALVRAIQGAASGLVVMDPSVLENMRPRQGSLTAGLTPRQQEVLAMMAQGFNNSAIAGQLVLGTKSVENYINAIYQELGLNHNGPLHPRVQAVLSYIRDSA